MIKNKSLIGIEIEPLTRRIILEKIIKYIKYPQGFFHIVSLNPENIVLSTQNRVFAQVVREAQIKIIDGVGVMWAARTLGIQAGERIAGVDLMKEMVGMANDLSLRVLLIGGKPNLALRLADCYTQAYPKAKFRGLEGIKDVKNPRSDEEKAVFSIVSDYKPHMMFVSFGSPEQELWLESNKLRLKGIVCMGVGGAFDYETGQTMRAPRFLRTIGLEWLFRLGLQPWRWRRQLRIVSFVYLVLRQKFADLSSRVKDERMGR